MTPAISGSLVVCMVVLFYLVCLVFMLSLLKSVGENDLGSSGLMGEGTAASACSLGVILMTCHRGTVPTLVKWQLTYMRHPHCEVACMWRCIPTGGRVGSGKEREEIERQTFIFRKCYIVIGNQRISLVHWKDNPGPLECAKQVTDGPFYQTWGILCPYTPRYLVL